MKIEFIKLPDGNKAPGAPGWAEFEEAVRANETLLKLATDTTEAVKAIAQKYKQPVIVANWVSFIMGLLAPSLPEAKLSEKADVVLEEYPEIPDTTKGKILKFFLNTKVGYAVAAIWFIVAAAGYFRDQRIAEQGPPAKVVDLVPELPGLKLRGNTVVWPSGNTTPRDGLVFTILTKEEYKKNPAVFAKLAGKDIVIPDDYFPVILQANASGFDATGAVVSIRRGSDGDLLVRDENAVPFVEAVTIAADSRYRIYDTSGSPKDIPESDLLSRYFKVAIPPKIPDNWETMTDEQLKEAGFTRIPREEYEKKNPPKKEDGLQLPPPKPVEKLPEPKRPPTLADIKDKK